MVFRTSWLLLSGVILTFLFPLSLSVKPDFTGELRVAAVGETVVSFFLGPVFSENNAPLLGTIIIY